MALKIRTTGLEQYAPGGDARVKMLVIGGPAAGKSRMSSYWPRPIFADCEGGLASIADRKTPFVEIRTSQDMLDLLEYLKLECRRPSPQREYQTVVIDTLDAFQRKVKDEWLQANPGSQSFRGFDAWGYLDAKMQMLLTRLLNLDMNVIVCVHYKDKIIKEGTGENATERQELMLQLSGEVKDSVFNDFDLVGWLGTYWEAVEGQRVEKRGLTFKRTPDKPFLKDRLFVTPDWMEITFSDEDYTKLFAAVLTRLDEMGETEEVGEIPSSTGGVPFDSMTSGALPPQDPREIPLAQHDRPTLQKMARDLGLPFKGNTVKSELLTMIEVKQAEIKAAEAVPEQPGVQEAPIDIPTVEIVQMEPPVPAPVIDKPEPVVEKGTESESVSPTPVVTTEPVKRVAEGLVNTVSGELSDAEAIKTVEEGLGGQVISITAPVDTPKQAPVDDGPACKNCGKSFVGEDLDLVKLSFIKYRKHLCNGCFKEARRSVNA